MPPKKWPYAPGVYNNPNDHNYATRSKVLPATAPPPLHLPRRLQPGNPRRVIADRIRKSWPITRSDKRPRGLRSSGVSCYVNSTLQTLLHLPKFCNWILEHCDDRRGVDWPCHAGDPNRQLPLYQNNDPLILKCGDGIRKCVPCLLKALVQTYWGNDGPWVLPHDTPPLGPLNYMTKRWFCKLPGAFKGGNEADDAARRLAEETYEGRKARENDAEGHQDADEFMRAVLNGCTDSVTYDPQNLKRLREFNSLFMLTRHQTMICTNCQGIRRIERHDQTEDIGFANVKPRLTGQDTLEDALARCDSLATETDTYKGLRCDLCRKTGYIVGLRSIYSAPEYLRIHLSLGEVGANQQSTLDKNIKIFTPIEIPEILDLTQYVHVPDVVGPVGVAAPVKYTAEPLRYKLISVIYHAGETTKSGHFVAGVTSVGDDAVQKLDVVKVDKTGRKRKRARVTQKKRKRGAAKKKVAEELDEGDEDEEEDERPPTHYFINDTIVRPWQGEDGENPLTNNPEFRGGAEFNASILMYVRLPNGSRGLTEEVEQLVAPEGREGRRRKNKDLGMGGTP
ncbi:cysteine proteinase [Dothidotthia symphoricarpi CBS 119687]|uniref:ubiquitinyl hydrolase 1 n=1 Tax=Dothidotthia symphoricarpi CBS 119687 TaxID=1392245 RepID=A0A6A6ADD3_9PLEO|nr:cysteine proteinase [Dothidotthia symphoricarpi CBS 119687]KAF2128974.1 cysteine proteinase [Dothidotthia symphoricarpi CBS 119687]